MYRGEKFYGRFSVGMYFFIWSILFAIISLVMGILNLNNILKSFPQVVQILTIVIPLGFALIFMIPGLWNCRGAARRRKICKYGTLCFGGHNVSINRRTIKQDFIYTMYKAYSLNFDFASDYAHIRQFVRGSDVQKILHAPILPLRSYNGEVVFDEKTFARLSLEDLKVVTKLYGGRQAYEKNKAVVDARIKTLRENAEKDTVRFNPDDEKFVEATYQKLKKGGIIKFDDAEIDRVWSLVDDEKHNYSDSSRLENLGGWILYAQANRSLLNKAVQPLLEGASKNNLVSYSLLGSIFYEKTAKPFVPVDRDIAKYCFSVASLMGGYNTTEKLNNVIGALVVKSERSDAAKLSCAALCLKALENNLSKAYLDTLFVCQNFTQEQKMALKLAVQMREENIAKAKAKSATDFDKFKAEHYEYFFKAILYNYVNIGLAEMSFPTIKCMVEDKLAK